MKKVVVASDHGGFEYKNEIVKYLKENNHEVLDVGTFSKDFCDYPLFAQKACQEYFNKKYDFIILVCTSGEGIAMAANKVKGIRCCIGYDNTATLYSRKHNDANAIAFGQNYMNLDDVFDRIDIFLSTEFEGGRHQRRVDEIEK